MWLPSTLGLLLVSPHVVASEGEPARANPPSTSRTPTKSAAPSKPTPKPKAGSRARGPVVDRAGFTLTDGGASRLLVHVSSRVPVEERREKHRLTYVLRGVTARAKNTTRPLETVHFRTPVVRASLVPKGADLWFVIELRSDAPATWKLTDAEDSSSTLTIDFGPPAGNDLPPSDVQDKSPPQVVPSHEPEGIE